MRLCIAKLCVSSISIICIYIFELFTLYYNCWYKYKYLYIWKICGVWCRFFIFYLPSSVPFGSVSISFVVGGRFCCCDIESSSSSSSESGKGSFLQYLNTLLFTCKKILEMDYFVTS